MKLLNETKYFMKSLLPDKIFLKIQFKRTIGKKLDLKNPKSFNEKVQWLKVYDRKSIYTKLADKYEVREYIKEKIGEEYLIPLIGVWDNFDQINFSELPNKFVLKSTHDSGGVNICKDKENFDISKSREFFEKRLKRNYYYHGREWPYKNIKPRIICEKYIEEEKSDDLKDYKFLCFEGQVKCSFVCLNRNNKNGLNVDFYDIDWNLMPFERKYPSSNKKIEKPKNYKKMIEIAQIIAKDIKFARIDFYEVNEKIYFGEITFYPGSGMEKFNPEEYDYLLGSWIKLPLN